MPLRYIRARGYTFDEMKEHCQDSSLCMLGDAILIWVNEGDLYGSDPVDMAAKDLEDKERQEYERLKAKFENIG